MSTSSWRARPGRIAALFVACFLADVPSAQAYLDPGTGSLAVQMLIGGAAAVVAGFANYRDKLLVWMRRDSGRDAASASPAPAEQTPTGDDASR